MNDKEFSRLEALFNLAINNSDINEVRNASVLFVKMIQRHNLLSSIRNIIINSNDFKPKESSSNNKENSSRNVNKEGSINENYKDLSFKHINYNFLIPTKCVIIVDYIINFLKYNKLNYNKSYIISLTQITNIALKDQIINYNEISKFTKYIKVQLNDAVLHNELIGIRGRNGGYTLK